MKTKAMQICKKSEEVLPSGDSENGEKSEIASWR